MFSESKEFKEAKLNRTCPFIQSASEPFWGEIHFEFNLNDDMTTIHDDKSLGSLETMSVIKPQNGDRSVSQKAWSFAVVLPGVLDSLKIVAGKTAGLPSNFVHCYRVQLIRC